MQWQNGILTIYLQLLMTVLRQGGTVGHFFGFHSSRTTVLQVLQMLCNCLRDDRKYYEDCNSNQWTQEVKKKLSS